MTSLTDEKIKSVKKLLVRNRILILDLLLKKETCVCEIVKALDLKHNLISHHLKTLIDMGYVSNRKNGQHVLYKLKRSKYKIVHEMLDVIRNN